MRVLQLAAAGCSWLAFFVSFVIYYLHVIYHLSYFCLSSVSRKGAVQCKKRQNRPLPPPSESNVPYSPRRGQGKNAQDAFPSQQQAIAWPDALRPWYEHSYEPFTSKGSSTDTGAATLGGSLTDAGLGAPLAGGLYRSQGRDKTACGPLSLSLRSLTDCSAVTPTRYLLDRDRHRLGSGLIRQDNTQQDEI